MIHSARSRTRAFGPAVFAVLLVCGGGGAFWFGLRAFRSQAQEHALRAGAGDARVQQAVVDLAALPAIAVLRTSSGEIGRATRVFTSETTATVEVLVNLPPLDTTAYTYDVWLVKDGLADVVNVGSLALRADGSWAGTFLLGPSVGIVDPIRYAQMVLMAEPRDGNAAPSGNKVGSGSW